VTVQREQSVKKEYQQDATIQMFIVNFTVLAPYNATPHNCNQPHPALPAQTPYAVIHGLCCPDDGHNDARNLLRQ